MQPLIATLQPSDIIVIANTPFVRSSKPIEEGDFLLDRTDGIAATCMYIEKNSTLTIKKGEEFRHGVPQEEVYRLTQFDIEWN